MSPIRMERVESALRAVIAFTECYNRHDVPAMLQYMTDSCVYDSAYTPPSGSVYTGKPAIAGYFQDLFARLPHAHLAIEETFGMGLRSVVLWRLEWVDASGDKQHQRGVDIFQVQNGLICSLLTYVKAQ